MTAAADLWVFAYGSLMWRPGFEHAEARPARLIGCHRALCIYSSRYRGTPERPGLVLGLDRGGSCRGVAFRVSADSVGPVRDYLREREMVNRVYIETMRPVVFDDGARAHALAYVADRGHSQYAGRLDREARLGLVRRGAGIAGLNRDYVLNTVEHLRALGVHDIELEWMADRL